MKMHVIERADPITQVKLIGSLGIGDMQGIDGQFEAVVTSARVHAIVDMLEVDFVSSIGMSMFVQTSKALKRTDHKLVLFGLDPHVKITFEHAGLRKIMGLVQTLEDAEALLAASA